MTVSFVADCFDFLDDDDDDDEEEEEEEEEEEDVAAAYSAHIQLTTFIAKPTPARHWMHNRLLLVMKKMFPYR